MPQKTRGQNGRIFAPKRKRAFPSLLKRLGYTFADLHCRTLDDMTEHEIQAIEREYGAKVIRPEKRTRRETRRTR